jgi:hypothetical protein
VDVLIVDAANVVGSRPDGWWRDRAGAAQRLHDQLVDADLPYAEIVLVVEGAAKAGVPEGSSGRVTVVHALGTGDDEMVVQVALRSDDHDGALVAVTADRELRDRVGDAGAHVRGPGWLLGQL